MMTSEKLKNSGLIEGVRMAACGKNLIKEAMEAEEVCIHRIDNQQVSKEEYDKAMAELTRRAR